MSKEDIRLLYIDLFCGAGGTSTGCENAVIDGRKIAKVIACVNHDANAIASHKANHPDALHFTEDIRTLELTPMKEHVEKARKTFPRAKVVLWASLECTNFSRAKGGMSRDADSRTLAEHLFRYVEAIDPDIIQIENVDEFQTWGPLIEKHKADGRAVIAGHTPFTIRLAYETTSFVQPISLGVDTGSVHVGLSATTDDKELYATQIDLRTDIVGNLSARREARRTRRSRLRYRAPRFNNRRASKKPGWLAPSTEQKVMSNVKAVTDVTRFLPVSSVTVEVAQFDTQWIKNPGLTGTDYQHGEQFGFWNVREYVLYRDGHRCRCCYGRSKDNVLNVHHIESRKTGGDSPGNLVTLCETCHKAYHKGEIKLPVKRLSSLRDTAAMTVMRWKVYERLKAALDVPIRLTYGYVTKHVRIGHGLAKSHVADARCISGHPDARPSDTVYVSKQLRRHNRKVMKSNLLKGGRWKRNQAPREIQGFRRFDIVKYKSEECFINALRTRGFFSVRRLDGVLISNGLSWKKLELIRHSNHFLQYKKRGAAQFPAPSKGGSTLV